MNKSLWQAFVSEVTDQSNDGDGVVSHHYGKPVQSESEAMQEAARMAETIPDAVFYTIRRIGIKREGD